MRFLPAVASLLSGAALAATITVVVPPDAKVETLERKAGKTGPVTVLVDKGTTVVRQEAGATPSPDPAPTSDFDTRKMATGVVRWFDFDTAAQLGGTYTANFGRLGSRPVIDTDVKASGAGSIRFDVAAQTTDDTHAWFTNFSPTLEQFGAGDTFYVQWRQRFNQAFVDTILKAADGTNQGGIKQAIIGAGAYGTSDGGSSSYATSCSQNDLVVQSYYQSRFPIVYHNCGLYQGLYEVIGGGTDFGLQNAMPSPYCRYTNGAGCFRWVANEWLTFKMMVALGPLVNGKYTNSTVKFWGAREGQPSKLLVDWKPTTPGYFPLVATDSSAPGGIVKFGKIWLTPYMTDKSRTQTHPLLQTWYDDLIISRADIADPK